MLMYPDEYRVMFEVEDHYWWYRGMREFLRSLLARYAPPNAMILDGGCGTGANLQLLQAYGTAIGIDLSDKAIGFSRARGIPAERTLLASLNDLPFRDDYFDLAISFEVICNIPDDAATFKEIARALKPGGRLIVTLPAYQWLWGMHDVAVGHQRRYSARDLREKMSAAGFEIERLTHANMLFFPMIVAERLTFRAPRDGCDVHSDLTPLPGFVNTALSALFTIEMQVAAQMDLPYGVSLIAVARKR
jgi:SAM-dependent methyltransferase